jgi:L-threonine kinase
MIDGKDFLITCPINCYSEVTVELNIEHSDIQQSANHSKAHLAVCRTLQHFNQPQQKYRISVVSALPVGKGMASSSADVSAAILATATCLGHSIPPRDIAKIALSIEPTDAVFFPGVMLFDHRSGRVCQYLGQPPELDILVFDFGGQIDTLFFNARADLKAKNRQKEKIVREAISLVKEGIRQKDIVKIGKAATLSALANQTILPKPRLEEVLHVVERVGAIGINVAHSGTVIGIMLDPQASLPRTSLIKEVSEGFPRVLFLQAAKLIGGGLAISVHEEGPA